MVKCQLPKLRLRVRFPPPAPFFMSKSDNRARKGEESPGSIEQGCRLTAGEGDFKDSATENKRSVNSE